MDLLGIFGLIIGIAGFIYAVVTNRRGEKQREKLVSKFEREREIDQQRYEEEKHRAIEANEAQRIRDHLRQEKEEQREAEQRQRAEEEAQQREADRFERENLERQRQYESERNREYLRRSGQRSRFDPKDKGWDASVTDDGSMITISNLTDKNFVNVVVRISDYDAGDWEAMEIARFTRVSAHSELTFPGKPTFDDVERITIEGFRENVSEHLLVKVPLAPDETMREYRSSRAYNAP